MEDLNQLIRDKRTITYYLFDDAKSLNIDIKEVSQELADVITNQAIKKFIDPKKGPLFCYGVLSPCISGSFPDEWGIISELEEIPENFLVFFDTYKDNHVLEINKISDFGKIVENTIVFSYYIVNKKLDFLVAWDAAHQILIGAGQAKEWVENLIERHKTK